MGYGVDGGKWFFLLTTVPHYLIVKIYIPHFKNDVTSPCSAFFSNGISVSVRKWSFSAISASSIPVAWLKTLPVGGIASTANESESPRYGADLSRL
jgi:hypothetical protein